MRTMICLILIVLCSLMAGCTVFQRPPVSSVPTPESGPEVLYQMVQKTDWLVTASILAAGLGVFAFLNGSGAGLKLVTAALVVLSMTLAVARFSVTIAVLAVVAAIALLGYTIWIKSTAIKEIVSGVQGVKLYGPTSREDINTILSDEQSPSTRGIVREYKNKLKERRDVLRDNHASSPAGDAKVAETLGERGN